MKIIKIDEYNIMITFGIGDASVLFPLCDSPSVARAVSAIARNAGMTRDILISYFPSETGGAAFVSSYGGGSGGSLEERYIYRFDGMQSFLCACREAGSGACAMTDGGAFYLSFREDSPVAGEFGGKRQSDDDAEKLAERLKVINTDVERLGELAL